MADDIVIRGLIQLQLQGQGADQAVASMTAIVANAEKGATSIKQVSKETAALRDGVTGLSTAFRKLGGVIGVSIGAAALVNFLKDSYIGFARVERQARVVENQIRSLGQAGEGAGFRAFIAQLAETSGILDDDLVPAFQRALTTFRDVKTAQETVGIAARFAAAGIGEVGANVEALTTFFQTGSARGLKPFVSDIKAGEDGTINLSEGLTQIYRSLNDLGKPLDDAQSRFRYVAGAWDTFRDTVGGVADELVHMASSWRYLTETLDPTGIVRARNALADLKAEAENIGPKAEDSQPSALANEAKRRQEIRDSEANRKEIADAADAAKKIATQRADLDAKTTQDILAARIALETEGSKERLALELQLLDAQKAAAINAATDIKASTGGIERLYELLKRSKQVAFNRAPKAADKTPDVLVTLMAEHEKAAQAQIEADKQLLELRKDLAIEGTAERMRAELAIELAALDEAETAILAKLEDGDERRTAIAEAYTKKRVSLIKKEKKAEVDMGEAARKADAAGYLAYAALGTSVLAAIFEDNKAVQYANAIVNTAAAIAAANTLPPPASYYAMAAAAAAGAIQIATIAKTHIGTSGAAPTTGLSGSAGGSTRALTQPPGTIDQIGGGRSIHGGQITVNINGGVYTERRAMRKLSRDIAKAARGDAGMIR